MNCSGPPQPEILTDPPLSEAKTGLNLLGQISPAHQQARIAEVSLPSHLPASPHLQEICFAEIFRQAMAHVGLTTYETSLYAHPHRRAQLLSKADSTAF